MTPDTRLDGQDGRPLVCNHYGACVTLRTVRAEIMRDLRCVSSATYTAEQRCAAVDRLLADPAWLAYRSGQYLKSVARDGASACFAWL